MGFNPYRVFKFVATQDASRSWEKQQQFQSLSGFQVRCNRRTGSKSTSRTLFQSLSGFQVRCNEKDEHFKEVPDLFQSLSGFQVRCNASLREWEGQRIVRFNPYRVFKFVATRDRGIDRLGGWRVSIPIGFSSSLQRFLLETNGMMLGEVSIPIGFSSSLQPKALEWPHRFTIGFNPYRVFKFVATFCHAGQRSPRHPGSFNPYRVFKFVATHFSKAWMRSTSRFNPYRVFKFVATSRYADLREHRLPVSIPIGFSSSLQHAAHEEVPFASEQFQSLSGFQVRCNIWVRRWFTMAE